MPVMTKMRDSMPVVFAVLAGIFLLMIIFEWGGQGSLFNSHGDAESMGTVNGVKITKKLYDRMLMNVTEKMKKDSKKSALSDVEEDQAADKAWDESVREAILQESMDKMNIVVTDQEVRDALFETPPGEIQRAFSDSTGYFHQKEYFQWLRDPKNDTIVRQLDQDVRDQLRHIKWQEVMISTIRVTDAEAKERYMVDSAKVLVQVVKIPAPPVPQDATKVVSDKELQDYYDAHSWQYKQEESRKFKFVVFRQMPNARDTATAVETARSIAARLSEAPLNTIDSAAKDLSMDYSDDPFHGRQTITQRDLGNDTSFLSKKAGDVAVASIGGRLSAVRILERGDTTHTLYHTRHIVISVAPPKPGAPKPPAGVDAPEVDSAKKIANVIAEQLRAGADFVELARTKSQDPKSALRGGDIGWNEAPPNAERSDPLAGAPINGIVGPIPGLSGFEIIQVLGKSNTHWTVVGVSLSIKPSHQTLLMQQQMANVFREQAVKLGFDEAAKASNYHILSDAPAAHRKGSPIFSSPAFVSWIFDASKGDISQPMKMTQQKFLLVAQLTEIIPAGPQPLAEVKERVAGEVAKRKAVASVAARAAQLHTIAAANNDIDAIAAQTGDSTLRRVEVMMGPAESVNGLPYAEYVINNWAFSAKPGELSPALKGNSGYYIAKLIERHVPTDEQFKASKRAMQLKLFQEREQRLMMEWVDNQKSNAKIVDFRLKR